ncbi:hypothetical protein [Streptomyces sp. NPDC050263]|uniref:hypothetical protein n=1 Tax=Streptomyces sp. NPDC050263 TaxID=3155037 RepID=UPI003420C5AD
MTVLLSAYVIEARGLPAWQPGTLFAINTVLVVLGQTASTGSTESRLTSFSASVAYRRGHA